MILALAACALAAAPPAAPPAKRVLVYTVSAGYEHDVVKRAKPDELSVVEKAIFDLGTRSGHFEAVPTRDAASFSAESLAKFDLVFFYTSGELPLSEEQRKALFAFVKGGKGFAGAHCASDTFYKVPEYGEMVGAYFDGHPWVQEVRIKVEDGKHPATAHLGASFSIADEIYQYKEPYDRKKLHVLLSLDTTSVDVAKPEVHRKDGDFALAWCRDYDKGRVFYTALGHRPEVWKDERFLAHLDGGFRWAMRAEGSEPANRAREPKDAAPEPKPDPKGGKKESEKPPRRALPIVSDGFAIDLVAEAPEILWPSSNACLPDGSLLVGEDRMDMPGPTDKPVDRVIRLAWKADGRFEKTVFAEKLYAVMGMEVVDGAVFVMNMPHLTRLEDRDGDGVAEVRAEVLTDLGPPAPGWPGGFNDHIVSGIRLGMDGFLYVAVGDKGIPGAHGTDGSTLQLRGGGVVRVRPDGSRLEVVATGLRNILDVAIDERGEMFTYDNTDDGLGWWTRLTHVVTGGHYGYPWDYKDHPERMLPCMAEYGGGSPTGGLAYREAAWPAEFHDNLFMCEWAKGALRRFVLEPSGATFRVKTAEDFVKAGDVKAFKPLDVCESPDGRFLYLSDWGYEGWQNPKEAGRIWRIRRADDDPRKPSAAKPLPKDVDGLVEALGDPSFGVRLRAQRELERRGKAVLPALRIAQDRAPERRARHARLAAESIDPVPPARAPGFPALGEGRELAFRGAYDAAAIDRLTEALASPSPALRSKALAWLGELHRKPEPWDGKWWGIQPAKTPPPAHVVAWECTDRIEKAVVSALDDARPDVRRAALEALRAMDARNALAAVRARWRKEVDDGVRGTLIDVLGALKDEEAAEILVGVVRDPRASAALRKQAIQAACAIRSPELVDFLAAIAVDPGSPAAHAVPCLNALGRLKEPRTAPVVARGLASKDETIRIAAMASLVDVSGTQAAPELEPLLRDPSLPIRRAALGGFERMRLADAAPKLLPLVEDSSTRDDAIRALAAAPDRRALRAYLTGLDSRSKDVRDAAHTALGAVRDDVRADVEDLCVRARLTEGQLAALQMIYSEPQPILDWRLFGPFERGKEAKPSDLDGAGDERRAEPVNGFLNLAKALTGESEKTAYARATVMSSTDREADMTVGSDDSVSVWVNGELVHTFADNRSFTADQDKLRVKLRAGPNTVLLLVGNATGGWSFNAKISGEATGPLFARKATRPDVEARRSYVLAHEGDPARGFQLFRNSRDESMCIRCHAVFGVGDNVGPDLSDIGAKYSREEILASILTPSQRLAEGYRSSSIELQDGRVLFGMVQRETKETIDLYDTNGEHRTIEKEDVASRGELDTSVMPDGLWTTLSAEDLTDLVAWLTTLRGAPGGK